MGKRNFFTEFGRGVKAYGLAFKMLFTSRFAWFMIFPVLAWILFFWLGGLLMGWLGNPVEEWIHEGITNWVGNIAWLHNAGAVVAFIFRVLIRFAYFMLFLFTPLSRSSLKRAQNSSFGRWISAGFPYLCGAKLSEI